MTPPVQIRSWRESDLAFVMDTWRSSFRSSSELHKVSPEAYAKFMARYIGKLLREPGASLFIACDPQDEDTILGYAAMTGAALHYVYVRDTVRSHGVARALLEEAPVHTYTLRTEAGDRRLKPRERGWMFAPRLTL